MPDDLAIEITEYLTAERQPLERGRLIAFIMADARVNSAWSRVSSQSWGDAIDAAVGMGLITQVGVMLRPAVRVSSQSQQLELF
jgi:hypothetical protein